MENNTTTQKISAKNRKFAAYASILAALALAVTIPVNLLANRLDIRWDMTPASLYKLSDKTTEYLSSIDEPLDMYFLMEMDYLKTDADSMALYYTLEEYSSYDCINFVDFDPNIHPEILQEINSEGLMNLSTGDIVVKKGDSIKRIPANRMYDFYVSESESGSRIVQEAYFAGENLITGAIRSVVTGKESTVYFISGHGEKSLFNDYSLFRANLNNINYSAKELNLPTTQTIPEDAEILLIADPKYDYTKDEIETLNSYLDNGGSLCFLMSPNEEKVDFKNLTSIMEDFGLGMDYDIVEESNTSLCIKGDPRTFQASIVRTDDEEDNENAVRITDEIVDMVENQGYYAFMSNTRSFYQYINPSDVSLYVGSLMQTCSNGTDEMGYDTATAVGKPYGGTNPLTEEIAGVPLDLAMYSTSVARNDAKIVVFGNSEFLDDEHVSEAQNLVTLDLFLASVTWMYNSEDDIDMGIQDKAKDYDYMMMNSEAKANSIIVLFFVVPAVVALLGVGVYLKRRFA